MRHVKNTQRVRRESWLGRTATLFRRGFEKAGADRRGDGKCGFAFGDVALPIRRGRAASPTMPEPPGGSRIENPAIGKDGRRAAGSETSFASRGSYPALSNRTSWPHAGSKQ